MSVDLVEGGQGYRPRNPLVATTIARSLAEGVAFERGGFSVGVDGDRGGAPSVEGGKLFWSNALANSDDVDVMLAPTALGVETFAVLRGAKTDAVRLRFRLPSGGALAAGRGGDAAEVLRDGVAVARVGAPVAVDGAGANVPVSSRIVGDVLEMRVDQSRAWARPILLDPPIEGIVDQSLEPSAAGWGFSTAKPESFSGSVGSGSLGSGQYQRTAAPAVHSDGDSGWWRYQAPRSSYVYRVDFGAVANVPAGGSVGAPPGGVMPPLSTCLAAGLHTGSAWDADGEWSDAGTVGGTGPFSTCGALSGASRTVCAEAGCPVEGDPGNGAVVQQSVSLSGPRASEGVVFVGSAAVYLSDDAAPYLEGSTAPARWYSSGLASWQVDARDDGLGVHRVLHDGPGVDVDGELAHGCTGLAGARCPARWTPDVAIDTAELAEGENAITLTARDAIERESAGLGTTVRVDRTSPVVGYSGALTSMQGRTIATDAGVQVDATDESGAGLRAGVRSIAFLVDGVQKAAFEQECAAGSCRMSRSWNFLAEQYSPGEHQVDLPRADRRGRVARARADTIQRHPQLLRHATIAAAKHAPHLHRPAATRAPTVVVVGRLYGPPAAGAPSS